MTTTAFHYDPVQHAGVLFVLTMLLGHLASYLVQRAKGQVKPDYRAYLREFPRRTVAMLGALAAAYAAAAQITPFAALPLLTLVASGFATGFTVDVTFNRGEAP